MPDTGTGTKQTQGPKNEVTFNVDGQGHIVGIINDPFHVSKNGHEHIKFFISDKDFDFTVDFNNSPFNQSHFTKAQSESPIQSGVPGSDTTYYKYEVTILRADGTVADSQDPGGYVDP